MKLCLRIGVLLFVITGALSQGFDLLDAVGDPDPTPPKPKDPPPKNDDLDLFEALGDSDPTPPKPKDPPKKDDLDDLLDGLGFGAGVPTTKPKSPRSGGGDGLDLEDALRPGNDPKPKDPIVPPRSGGGGGSFDDSDLLDVNNEGYKPDGGRSGGGTYNPDGGRSGGGGSYDPHGGADQPQAEAGSGQIAGIVSAVGVALVGAASSYIAYQKKKLCFKLQGGADPESGKGHHGTQSDPQVFSNLLRTN